MTSDNKTITSTVDTQTTPAHEPDQPHDPSRRTFLCSASSVGAMAGLTSGLTAGGLLPVGQAHADDFSIDDNDPAFGDQPRIHQAARLKIHLAKEQKRESRFLDDQKDNNDEQRYEDERYYASFHKTLPQNRYGEVNPRAYRTLQQAMRTGAQHDFDSIPLANPAVRKLANPQGAFRYEMTGLDSHATRMPPAPRFRSAKTAAEMGEVYWQALTRDVPFIDYSHSYEIDEAVNDLNHFKRTVGPKQQGRVTPSTLFRGETAGDLNGPYISQFLYKDIPYGPSTIVQKYPTPLASQDFMVDQSNWLNVQRGGAPAESLIFDNQPRYLFNNRALGEYVHTDVLFQAYFNAALILLGLGAEAIDENNPYRASNNQGAFTSLGGPWVLQLLSYASNLSLSGAWFQKWRVHRRCRPEVYAGRVHFNVLGQRDYELHGDILDSVAVQTTYHRYGSYFLPMAFTEGSPTHPAYPAGHATIAGACCTILKAFFNEEFVIPDPVQADATGLHLLPYQDSALTVGGEIDKLANNISIGRDAAGVHYRSDGVDGLTVGEQQAIRLLQDHLATLNEDIDGFSLTKFDGERVLIQRP